MDSQLIWSATWNCLLVLLSIVDMNGATPISEVIPMTNENRFISQDSDSAVSLTDTIDDFHDIKLHEFLLNSESWDLERKQRQYIAPFNFDSITSTTPETITDIDFQNKDKVTTENLAENDSQSLQMKDMQETIRRLRNYFLPQRYG